MLGVLLVILAVMKQNLKSSEQMQRHFKGIANHYRIEILLLVVEKPDVTVEGITGFLHANFKTISQHTRYLVQAGLLQKRYKGRTVRHSLSSYGRILTRYIQEFQRIQ
jgi:predicted transcriptional regulator